MNQPLPDLHMLKEKFNYFPMTGEFRHWSNGKVAGHIDTSGYRRLRVSGKQYQAHRIAYYLVTHQDPEDLMVDHIDGDKANNAFSNLQLVTNQQNQQKSRVCNNNPKTINGTYTEYGKASRRKKQGLQHSKTVGETNHGCYDSRS